MKNPLSKKFTTLSLIKFTAPTVIMMVFMSIYTMVDGIFVSRYVGTNALSAVNIVYPIFNIVIAIAVMLGTGGSAIIAKKMGEDKTKEARSSFTFLVVVGLIIGFCILILGLIYVNPIIKALGATTNIFSLCKSYFIVLTAFTPFAILQMMFQSFFVTSGKPKLGLFVVALGGIANIVLDYIFIVPMKMGIAGAALATGIGMSIPAIFGLLYFSFYRSGFLYFTKFKFDKILLLKSCTNGSSEMVTNLSTAITTFLFNIIMIRFLGEDGVAAITIVLYAQFLLTAFYLGYSSGVAPVISYNHGNKNHDQLKKIFKISIFLLVFSSIIIFTTSLVLSTGIITIFAPKGTNVFLLAKDGFVLFSISFLFTGINIFASAMFTAFSNGKISAILSFLRTFVFIVLGFATLPRLLDINGVWLSVPFAEVVSLLISLYFMKKYTHIYKYA